MEMLNSIKNWFSPRAFPNQKVEDDEMVVLFEAARWAYIKQYYKNKFFESLNDVKQWLAKRH